MTTNTTTQAHYVLQSCATRHSCNYVLPRGVSPSMCPVRQVRGCEMLVHRCSVNQRLPSWKPITYLLNTQGG
jgi:hypothetical protein